MILAAIQAFFEALKSGFSYAETAKENQCETEVLKEKRHQEKQNDKQEDLLIDMAKLLLKYQGVMTKTDRIRVNVYAKRIKGVN